MTRPVGVAHTRPVFTITSLENSLVPVQDCDLVRPTIEHERKPLLLPYSQVTASRSRLIWLVPAGLGVGLPALFAAGLALGSSELGAAILTAAAAGLGVLVVIGLVLVVVGRAVDHCPGCPR